MTQEIHKLDLNFMHSKDAYRKLPNRYEGMKGHCQVKVAGHMLDIIVDKNGLHVCAWRPSGKLELTIARFSP